MARQYHRRPDAKRATISIPISEHLRDQLWLLAAALQRSPTEIAREAIERRITELSGRAA